jgi:hypothetical protein
MRSTSSSIIADHVTNQNRYDRHTVVDSNATNPNRYYRRTVARDSLKKLGGFAATLEF